MTLLNFLQILRLNASAYNWFDLLLVQINMLHRYSKAHLQEDSW